MQRLVISVILAFLTAMALGPVVVPLLKRMKFGQTIYDLGPESHKKKQGIPIMGGIIFVIPMVFVPLLLSIGYRMGSGIFMVLLCTLGFGAVGFADDFIKVKLKRSQGLTPIQKIVPQVAIAIIAAVWAFLDPRVGSSLRLPFAGREWDLGWFYIPAMVFILVGTVNSANLLDGLDGLLSSVSMVDFSTMAAILLILTEGVNPFEDGNMHCVMLFCGAAAGSIMGFLRVNAYPARIFMGDVGSFTLGGALAGVCMATRLSLLLPIIALAMVVSSLSVIIQMAYYKVTHGKRIFLMSPLHHHFELSGMKEPHIISMYTVGTVLLCLVVLADFVG